MLVHLYRDVGKLLLRRVRQFGISLPSPKSAAHRRGLQAPPASELPWVGKRLP